MIRSIFLPALMFAAPALAAPVGHAEFAAGTTVRARIVVNDTLWNCAGTSCTGPGETRTVAMQRACGTLARSGAITALTVNDASLSAEDLARCNAKAGHATGEVAAK